MLRTLSSLSLTLAVALPAMALADDPVTIENCGAKVTFEGPVQDIFLVNNDSIPLLSALGALDRVVARTSRPLDSIYDESVYDALEAIPLVTSETNATGGAVISFEALVAAEPDLVLAPQNAVDRELLSQAGIAAYSPPAYCDSASDGPQGEADFARVYDELRDYGTMLGLSERAEKEIVALKNEVEAFSDLTAEGRGTAAAIYVSSGGRTLSPYGAGSMVTPIFEAAGLSNVYADTPERVFDVNVEDLLGRDPETIVLLYSAGTPEAVIETFLSIPSTQGLTAVKEDRVLALQFPYTDPPTPLSIRGAEILADKLDALP